ncbi:lipoprotein bor [Vibrio variabilis]|uniref:Lipoprotein bor n=1 Tax=Vibrio variabilis TaxID=990271 RepID=A0ABR4YDS6_9VIBR|nr:Bor family protein [Vibrio variabilis]KHA61511.1 lipoprotein bor [Vibrio variabilis]
MKKVMIIAALSVLATGCAQQTFVMSKEETSKPTTTQSHHFFIDGLAQKKEVDAAGTCGSADKVAKVEVQKTFVNGLLEFVTLGIYTPREARVYCK